MIVVIDVSGAVHILTHKEKAEKFEKVLQEATRVISPDLYISELTNTFWKHYTHKIFSMDECGKYIQDGIDYIDSFIDSQTLWQEAFAEGVRNNHSIYDMFYLVAARRNGATLVTNDSDLAEICKKNGVKICC